jgi:hypothetical protein
MRSFLFWLLPLYNLVTAIGLLRQLAFHDPESPTSAPVAPRRAAVWLSWVLAAAAVASLFVVGDRRYFAVPFVLGALNALAIWRLTDRPRARRSATREASAGD